ncbi:MAG: VTT domain-containing protein [Candidatus Woesebacteria bacterium]|nr:VTT domain-containing protein [Candidatus Woesebacteria bacterium]
MKIPKLNLTKENLIKFGFILASILISGVIIYFRNSFVKLEGYGYLGIFLISILGNSTVIIPAPVILTAFVGGSIFNPILVGIITAMGATIGELTGFMAGFGGQAIVSKSKNYEKIERWIKKSGFLTIFILAIIPNPLFDLAGIISGITKYPLKKFLLATLLGKSIKFLVVALIGAYSF